MVLRRLLRAIGIALPLLATGAAGSLAGAAETAVEAKPAGDVTLPLADYLSLVEKGDRLERERAAAAARREAPVAEVVAQQTSATLDEGEAEIFARYEVLVQGAPQAPVLLPFAGLARQAEVRRLAGTGPAETSGGATLAALATDAGRGVRLVAPGPGRYAVEVRGRAALADQGGVRRLTLAPVAAPVAEVAVDLPADLAWSAPGTVVVEERAAGARRTVRLASRRGASQAFEVQRRLDGTEAERLLAQSVVLTLFQLRPEGLRRHDVVLYEVSRGSLPSLAVDLPADLAVDQVATDEGDVVPALDARHLAVQRRRQLSGIGYLVLTSRPQPGAILPAAPVVLPANIEVRARYLALASTVAADVQPRPAASWSRVDLSDLPPALGEALAALDLTAAWRLTSGLRVAAEPALQNTAEPALQNTAEPALAVALLPLAPRLPTLVRRRETTTLLTVDGTVLHRDRFTLDQAPLSVSALDIVLPPGAVLWSAKVGEQPVRPVERGAGGGGGGSLSIPLGFATGVPPVVEVVSVAERTIPKGRSALTLALPQVAAPVVEHQWRLLLPEGAHYRFKRGDLQPAREPPTLPPPPKVGGVAGGVVGGVEGGVEETIVAKRGRGVSTGATVTDKELANIPTARDLSRDLQNGLVGGVKPLPVTIPEAGKALLLTGALPPPKVAVELEVKGKR
jgi:hypothetical protein